MSVKRYSVGVDGVDPNGNLVKYTDYAALEARCAALAEENAGLKESVEHAAGCVAAAEAEGLIDALEEKDGERLADLIHRRLCHAHLPVETPATDAFLAEVRAQGVGMFAESQKEYVRKNRDELDSMTRAAYCGSAVDAERFAAQLREGVI